LIPELYLYFILVISATVLGAYRWKALAKSEKFVALLMPVTLIAEIIAAFAANRWRNNYPVFHIYSPIEFLLISLYFNYAVRLLRKNNIGIILGAAGIPVALINTIFFQPIHTINAFYLLFEGVGIIFYSLCALYEDLISESRVYNKSSFWFTLSFLIYWGVTFTGWGIYKVQKAETKNVYMIVDYVLTIINYLFYAAICLIFLRYNKRPTTGARQ
jgi:hypothetical protein